MSTVLAVVALAAGVAMVVAGAELFAEHLAGAARGLGVTAFAISVVLAGSETEELATAVTGSVRHLPAVSFGDVVGANIAACLVALAVGAFVAPLPFGRTVRRYALLALPLGAVGAIAAWGGRVPRPVGALLVLLYVGYVVVIWMLERRRAPVEPESAENVPDDPPRRGVGLEIALVLAGVAVLAIGSLVLVEAVGSISAAESTQTDVSLTLVGLATTLELVVLAWSTARRGHTEAVVGAVVGSFAFNATLSLGVAALARPLRIVDAGRLRAPLVIMMVALAAVIVLGGRRGRLGRADGVALLACYAAFVAYVAVR
jgi:cation:H+ antiporter